MTHLTFGISTMMIINEIYFIIYYSFAYPKVSIFFKDIHFIHFRFGFFSLKFVLSVEMVKIYASEHLYDEFVVTSSGLLLLAGGNQQVDRPLEQILFEATLIDDARHITILRDIWTLFLRYYTHLFHA